MPSLAIFKTIKFWAILIPLIGVIAVGYFAVRNYRQTLTENVQLKQDVAVAKAEKKTLQDAQRAINTAVTSNDTNTRTIIERTHTIEEKIRETPTTTQCVDAPAVRIMLDDYRLRNNADATGSD